MTTQMVHVRLDSDTKALATEALAAMGVTVSAAVRLFCAASWPTKPCRWR